jgi:hypothetical protein
MSGTGSTSQSNFRAVTNYPDEMVQSDKALLRTLGFHNLLVLTSKPPKLVVNLAAAPSPEDVDEVARHPRKWGQRARMRSRSSRVVSLPWHW